MYCATTAKGYIKKINKYQPPLLEMIRKGISGTGIKWSSEHFHEKVSGQNLHLAGYFRHETESARNLMTEPFKYDSIAFPENCHSSQNYLLGFWRLSVYLKYS